jgi:phage terminase Nu1 subunit (DNA packaging protein)
MDTEISAAALQRLLASKSSVLCELAVKGIIVRGRKRGIYALSSVARYCQHLRDAAAGRGGDAAAQARARLGSAQADLADGV